MRKGLVDRSTGVTDSLGEVCARGEAAGRESPQRPCADPPQLRLSSPQAVAVPPPGPRHRPRRCNGCSRGTASGAWNSKPLPPLVSLMGAGGSRGCARRLRPPEGDEGLDAGDNTSGGCRWWLSSAATGNSREILLWTLPFGGSLKALLSTRWDRGVLAPDGSQEPSVRLLLLSTPVHVDGCCSNGAGETSVDESQSPSPSSSYWSSSTISCSSGSSCLFITEGQGEGEEGEAAATGLHIGDEVPLGIGGVSRSALPGSSQASSGAPSAGSGTWTTRDPGRRPEGDTGRSPGGRRGDPEDDLL